MIIVKIFSALITKGMIAVMVGIVILLDVFTAINIFTHHKFSELMIYKILIINYTLVVVGTFYLVLRYLGKQWDKFARLFFEFSNDEIKLTSSKVGELFGYIGSAMLIGTIIKSQSHKYYEIFGIFGASLINFFLYFIGCLFISVFLIKLTMILKRKNKYAYMFWMMSAMAMAYYLYDVGFSLG